MKGLSLKYLLRFGLKKTKGNIFPIVISVLLCMACAILFTYAETFSKYDRFSTVARTIIALDEEDYQYERFSFNGDGGLFSVAADYLAENYTALKYVKFPLSDRNTYFYSDFSDGAGIDFFMANSADDVLSFGYTFYGDYEKNLTESSAYVSDSYLKDGKYYFYEDGQWELQDYSKSIDTSAEWFSSFVGKDIYPEGYEGSKINIAGVVNTGSYSLSFRDLELEGEDEYENNINDRRNSLLYSQQKSARGIGIFCSEDFMRSFAVKEGSVVVGGAFAGYDAIYYDDGHDVSFSIAADGKSVSSISDENISISNTARSMNQNNRLSSIDYADDKDYRSYYLREPTKNDAFIDSEKEVMSDSDICGEDEIMITKELYKQLFDEKYNYSMELPSHIGEKITVTVTVNGKTYEIKDKTLVGVYESPFYYYSGDWDTVLGIICPCAEADELIADYALKNYGAAVNINSLNEDELAELLRAMDEDYNCPIYTAVTNAADFEAENVGGVKGVYMIISAAPLALSLLFGIWNVLHTVKRDYREIGILRANGVTARDMSVIYAVQFIIGGVLSFIMSLIGLNILVSNYRPSNHNTLTYMQYFPEFTLYWVSAKEILLLVVLNLIVPLIVSVFALFKVRKISPVEAINEAKRNE